MTAWKRWIATGIGTLAAVLAIDAGAQTAEVKPFKVAYVQAKDHPHGLGAQKFADLVEQKSGGRMKAAAFGSGTLGGDAQVISSLQGGTIDVTIVSTGLLSTMNKDFAVFYLPMVFNDGKEADAVVDGPFGQKLLDKLPEKGLVGLAWWEHGFRSVTNSKRPITRWEDLQGLKVRVIQIPIFVDIYNALGANAVPMPFPELYTALEQKAVDGQETALATIDTAGFAEVQKFLSTTRIVYDPLVVLISKKTWDRMNADEQRIVTASAKEATSYERQLNREREAAMLKASPAKGMAVNDVSAAERERMRQQLKPVADKYLKQMDAAVVSEFMAEIAKARSGAK